MKNTKINVLFVALKVVTQFTFTFSKSTIDTLEKGVEHILNEKQANQNDVMTSFWYFYC